MAGKIDDNTLRTKQQFSVLIAMGEGITELSNVYMNEVTIKDLSIDVAYTKGAVTQRAISGFDFVGGDIIERGELLNDTPVIINLTNDEHFIDVIIGMPEGLYWHTAKGGLRKSSLRIQVSTSPSLTAPFTLVRPTPFSDLTINKDGKTMSPYITKVRIEKPDEVVDNEDWRIKVQRVDMNPSGDGNDGESFFKNKTTLSTQSYYDSDGTTYAGTALCGLRIEDASQVGNKVPPFAFEGKGMGIALPISSYYNAETRIRTGNWNGTFEPGLHYSNNLSWCIYSMLGSRLNKRIPTEKINKNKTLTESYNAGIATFTINNHQQRTGDIVYIQDALYQEANGFKTITVINANQFEFAATGTTGYTRYAPVQARETTILHIGADIPENALAKYSFEAFAKVCDQPLFKYTALPSRGKSITIQGDLAAITVIWGNHGLSTGTNITLRGTQDTFYERSGNITVINVNTFTIPVGLSAGATPPDETSTNFSFYTRRGEPRYTLNGQFVEMKSAEEFINDILSIGNAQLAHINGLIAIVYDRKLTPTEYNTTTIFTNQNVVDGLFEYSGSHISENYTQVNVTIQDKDNFNKTKTIIVQSKDLVRWLNQSTILPADETAYTAGDLPTTYFSDKFGYNIYDITLMGVTSEAAATRKAKSLLWDSLMNDTFVSFRTVIEGAVLHRGQVIRLADSGIANIEATGRLLDFSHDGGILEIILDREVSLSGISTISFYKEGVSLETVDLTDTSSYQRLKPTTYTLNEVAGLHSVVHITTSDSPRLDSIFYIKGDLGIEYPYTIVSNTKEEDFYVTSCIRYDFNKFDYVDSDFFPYDSTHSPRKKYRNTPVTIDYTQEIFFTDGLGHLVTNPSGVSLINGDTFNPHATIRLKWEHDGNIAASYGEAVRYRVNWSVDTGHSGSFMEDTKQGDFNYTIPVEEDDLIFTFTITTESNTGYDSIPVTFNKTYIIQRNPETDTIGMIEG